MKLTAIDLFSGAGGLSLGLKAAGFIAVAAVERDPDAVATYRCAVGADEVIDGDASALNYTRFRGVDLVAGGPPCQPFSTGGLRRGRGDERDLLPTFVRAVLEAKPRAFLLENVPGLATAAHAEYLHEVLAPLFAAYDVSGPHLVNAADFGVPQSRRRMIMIGFRDGSFRMPVGDPNRRVAAGTVLKTEPLGEPNTSKIVYAKTPDLRPSPYHGQLFNGGGRPIDLAQPAPTMLASAGGNKTHWIDIGNLVPPYHMHLMKGGKPRIGELPHARRLTVEECALLQTFPAGMAFFGARSSRYTQVGNAVPVKLAAVLGAAIAEQLSAISGIRYAAVLQDKNGRTIEEACA